MINITLTITAAPELLNIFNGFVGALGLKKELSTGASTPEDKQPECNAQQFMQVPYTPPAQQVYVPQAPIPNTPNYPPAVPTAQQSQTQAMPPSAPVNNIPTSTQSYSMEQLAVAATQIVDAGRRTELVNLLASFGVQALTALPKEQYGAFATQLRAMGAKI